MDINAATDKMNYFNLLLDKISVGIQIVQLLYNDQGKPIDYLFLDVNSIYENFIGFAKEEIVGKKASDFNSNIEPEWFIKYGEIVKTGKTEKFEMFNEYHGLWFDVLAVHLGQEDKFAIIYRDITEHKESEIAILKSEEKYRTIFETSQEGIWVIDRNDETILVNDRLQQMLGYSLDEMVGKSPQVYMAPEFKTRANESLAKHMGGMKEVIDYKFLKKDGSYLWCILSSTPLFDKDGKFDGSIAMITDITGRKLAEEALKKSEKNALELVGKLNKTKEELINALHLAEQKSAEWNAIADAIPDGLSVYGKRGETLYMNDAVINFDGNYDYMVKSSFEKKIEKLESTHLNGDKIDIEETGLYLALNSGKTTRDYRAMTKMKSGEIMYSSHSGGPIKNNIGEITGAVMIHRNITERVELEKKTDKLVEELRVADKNKNDFINMLSHELRNPLASIMMGLELLERATPGGEQAMMALSIAKRQGKMLTNLVDDLLDVTRITQNKVSLKKETIEINELIDKAVEDYQPQFLDKNVKLEISLTTPLYIEGDYTRLTQVISNLLHNAAKFTDADDLVTISVRQDTITNEVIIRVDDSGRGMDPEDQLNLFEPFRQVDESLDRKLGGLGLGLSVVKEMVELHGGKVDVFSEGIGTGTKFTIRLPL